ncbi:MAG TPA: hypothetical protein DDW50_09150 [Firmicutes bacterium]|jgi:periplasmic protein TonB|nr:hypothetical protein [Bacillota bacterium]
MFKKCLLVSIAFHIILFLGAGLDSSHSSAQQRPPVFEIVSARMTEAAGARGPRDETGLATVQKAKFGTGKSAKRPDVPAKVSKPFSVKEQPQEAAVDLPSDTSQARNVQQADPNPSAVSMVKNGTSTSGEGHGEAENTGIAGSGNPMGSGGAPGNPQGFGVQAPQKSYTRKADYPQLAKEKGWQGTVFLEAALGKNGRVEKITVIRSSGFEVLDQEALKTVKKWRYQAATQDGKPIEWRLRIKYVFNLED